MLFSVEMHCWLQVFGEGDRFHRICSSRIGMNVQLNDCIPRLEKATAPHWRDPFVMQIHRQPLDKIERRQQHQHTVQRTPQRRCQASYHHGHAEGGYQHQIPERIESEHRPLAGKDESIHEVYE